MTYIWTNNESGHPVLDTVEKLTAYATAVLHSPADPDLIHFEPLDLQNVHLKYGITIEEQHRQMADLMKQATHPAKNQPPDTLLHLLATIPPSTPIPIGIVDGIAAETILAHRRQQETT